MLARHIGGAVNYVAVAGVLDISPAIVAAGLAADNLMNAFYFAGLFYLARSTPTPREDTPEYIAAAAAASTTTEGGASDGRAFQ